MTQEAVVSINNLTGTAIY